MTTVHFQLHKHHYEDGLAESKEAWIPVPGLEGFDFDFTACQGNEGEEAEGSRGEEAEGSRGEEAEEAWVIKGGMMTYKK